MKIEMSQNINLLFVSFLSENIVNCTRFASIGKIIIGRSNALHFSVNLWLNIAFQELIEIVFFFKFMICFFLLFSCVAGSFLFILQFNIFLTPVDLHGSFDALNNHLFYTCNHIDCFFLIFFSSLIQYGLCEPNRSGIKWIRVNCSNFFLVISIYQWSYCPLMF